MAYGSSPIGSTPYGSDSGRVRDKNEVSIPTMIIQTVTNLPIVGVEYQYTTRKHNALERSSPCPE